MENYDEDPAGMPIYAKMEVSKVRTFGEGYAITATNPFGVIFTCYCEADPLKVGDKFTIYIGYDE